MENYDSLLSLFEKSLNESFNELTLDELKKIDWLCWNSDFFIEQDQQQAA